jgi:ERF superfamily
VTALAEALAAAQAELPTAIERDSQGYGYRYTSLDKLIAATRPILNAHGIIITQWPSYAQVADELRPILATSLTLGDETWKTETPLYVTDKTMQGFGAAITYARRYAWAAALGIASEEDTDAVTVKPDEEEIPF